MNAQILVSLVTSLTQHLSGRCSCLRWKKKYGIQSAMSLKRSRRPYANSFTAAISHRECDELAQYVAPKRKTVEVSGPEAVRLATGRPAPDRHREQT
jgi:hypothetical protein